MTARVVLHIPARMIAGVGVGKPLLYTRIRDCLLARGAGVDLVEGFDKTAWREDGNLHIVENGAGQRPGVLNAATAYFGGFFHVDPVGMQAASSIGGLSYDPAALDPVAAAVYFQALRQRFVAARQSRYKQAKAVSDIPRGALAVFLQGPAPLRNGQAYCDFKTMLRAVCAGAGGREVVVKPHPLQLELGAEIIASIRAEGFQVIETAANVHDILAACSATVSINSATALEGFLHGKPAVLFGRSDFHALVQTARKPAEFEAALARALANPPDYARALYWYFGLNCLDMTADSFEPRLLAIFDAAGFDAARLGLS
ncbi:hypothetical protein GCM10010873_13510 [Cypionkella aquatica]|uniref:Capsular polysaccharide biosynthesis protein n=1 Tax=Cypionkella aquatica TaxID=1756042 RepID=A0AA37TRU7_9RHOB|nr:hypothetical protein [Cypionkella aquatica]GLS86377.1 hypothetical protein GCM10010873_13510 [Cypionkella aquatica]